MQTLALADAPQRCDELVVDGVELVGVLGKRAVRYGLFEPAPLEVAGLVERGWRVGVVFKELGGPAAVIREVEAPVEARLASIVAVGDRVPRALGNLQPRENALVTHGAANDLVSHLMKLDGRGFQILLYLFESEGVIARLVPVGFAAGRVENEPFGLGRPSPIEPLAAGNAPHGSARR